MKSFMLVSSVLLLISSCNKSNPDNIYGNISVTGKITDFVSNQPIANCKVTIYSVYFETVGELSGPHRVQGGPLRTVLTDSLGNYSFSIDATGQYEFDLTAEPSDALHVSSVWTFGQDYTIKNAGSHTKDLKCRRSAYARIQLRNIPPIDTPYLLSIQSYSNISLYNFYKDSIVYLKLVGRTELNNNVRFTGTNKLEQNFNFIAGPWDTISLQINY